MLNTEQRVEAVLKAAEKRKKKNTQESYSFDDFYGIMYYIYYRIVSSDAWHHEKNI